MTDSNSKTQGVFVMKGLSSIGFIHGDEPKIRIDEHGKVTLDFMMSTSFNVLPVWVRCAHEHLLSAHAAGQRIVNEWNDNTENRRQLLINELEACLQVVITCGVILDTLYGLLEPHALLTDATKQKWREKGTARYAKISHIIHSLYKISNNDGRVIRANLKSVLQFRNDAVHPSSQIKRPTTRPDISVNVDWWFGAFRYSNAAKCWETTMGILYFLIGTMSKVVRVNEIMKNIADELFGMNLISTPEKKNGGQS
jgi:hypothetical protein